MTELNIISYWKEIQVIYIDENGFTVLFGQYDHFNQGEPIKALGIHWGDFPKSRGVLAPSVIPPKVRNAMLSGLFHDAVTNGDTELIEKLTRAVEFFKE